MLSRETRQNVEFSATEGWRGTARDSASGTKVQVARAQRAALNDARTNLVEATTAWRGHRTAES